MRDWKNFKRIKKLNALPEYLLLENVKNMTSKRHSGDYLQWLKFLKSLGYNTQTYLLNAKDYGILQARVRVYALSVLNNKKFKDTYTKTKNIIEKNNPKDVSKKFNIYKNIEDILKVDYSIKKYLDEGKEATPNKTPSREKECMSKIRFYIQK